MLLKGNVSSFILLLPECEKADNEKNKKAIVTLLKGAIHKDLGNKNVAKQVFTLITAPSANDIYIYIYYFIRSDGRWPRH